MTEYRYEWPFERQSNAADFESHKVRGQKNNIASGAHGFIVMSPTAKPHDAAQSPRTAPPRDRDVDRRLPECPKMAPHELRDATIRKFRKAEAQIDTSDPPPRHVHGVDQHSESTADERDDR